ncbi:endonuclease [Colwellia sp. RSH04]|uniref:endonuclease n=1 Tax=Colwellia sp. RSH04 TaxID=2305464 RepID=UPI000E5892EF|nr:endonuclease [Colwellia sp. RSH04]RHW77583.1 deoxyribonuclease I [Colwellia sp. RSH04]
MNRFLLFVLSALLSATALADYPTSFSNAKSKAEKAVYFDKHTTFYCGCDYVFDDTKDKDGDGNTHETMIYPENCGYKPRNPITKKGKPNARVSRIEWEHIVPAHVIGGHLDEWKNKRNYPECKKSNGKFMSGRDCAYKLNQAFKKGHDDMNNLTPAVGELNGDRSNFAFAVVQGEQRSYGQCDFEIDFDKDVAEPPDNVKGNIARTYFHMIKEHNAQIPDTELTMYLYWDKLDPVDEWECLRNKRIETEQGLGNSFVDEACKVNPP